jgi:hypothetical protein
MDMKRDRRQVRLGRAQDRNTPDMIHALDLGSERFPDTANDFVHVSHGSPN